MSFQFNLLPAVQIVCLVLISTHLSCADSHNAKNNPADKAVFSSSPKQGGFDMRSVAGEARLLGLGLLALLLTFILGLPIPIITSGRSGQGGVKQDDLHVNMTNILSGKFMEKMMKMKH